MPMLSPRLFCIASLLTILGAHADAQWAVVDLHPAGASRSRAYGVAGGQQVGYAQAGVQGQQIGRASLWSSTAASWVDLNPAGASQSAAYDVDGGQQVGDAVLGGVFRASLWSGTAASWVDLNPAGLSQSIAHGVGGGQQVGYADVGGALHASLWSGTAASWVDLNPAGWGDSRAYGVDGGQQVGSVALAVGGAFHASLWSGTAASWVDLSSFLPPSTFSRSIATGIWSDSTGTYVSGYGFNVTTGRDEALLWLSPVPEPASLFALGTGLAALRLRRRKMLR